MSSEAGHRLPHKSNMGVHRLNQFLRAHGGAHVQEIAVQDLHGKRLAVDASIYMYRFLGDQCLLAGIYQMGTLFRRWGVDVVFVFDGAPPKEKREAQQERQKKKEDAYLARRRLEEEVASRAGPIDAATNAELALLRRKSLRLGRRRVAEVRALLGCLGIACMDAQGEADSVCAGLVASGDCWGCLSDDTDLFASGCPRVLRRLCLETGTCDFYDWAGQRKALGISQSDFQVVCAAAGCDYGPGVPGLALPEAWSLWARWSELRPPYDGSLAEYLVGGGCTWRGGDPRELEGAAEVFREMGSQAHRAPAPPSASRGATREFLEAHGFVFACE